MSSGLRLRSDGKRKTVPHGRASADLIGPALGLSSDGRPGERRLNGVQMSAIDALYHTHPAITAAVNILKGQLLSSGLSLVRNGTPVELKPAFKAHLENVWLPFAADVIDSFLKFGFVVMSYEVDEESLSRQSIKRQRGDAETASASSASTVSDAPATGASEPTNLYPVVPPLGTYDVAYVMAGRAGYVRKYLVYARAPNQATKIDEEARVIMRQQPDGEGNLNSPMAVVFDTGSFTSCLIELAVQAETSNTRPRMVTQQRKKETAHGIETSSLFFDAEARSMQAGADGADNASQLQQLSLTQQMAQIINKLQTRGDGPGSEHQSGSFSGGATGGRTGLGKTTFVPPEVSPAIFTLPKEQEMAPSSGQVPQARGDLEALCRLSIEQISAAFGVPSDLIFSGRFASKTTSQLALLNSTVAQLERSVSHALTMAYRDVYGEEGGLGAEPARLELITSPLAATEEVVGIFAAGLMPVEVAMKACMNAVGASKDEIDAAVEVARKEFEEKKAVERENQKIDMAEKKQGLAERKAAAAGAPKREGVDLKQASANVAKTQAETAAIASGSRENDKKDEGDKKKAKDEKKKETKDD
jgi:hypothetical protein